MKYSKSNDQSAVHADQLDIFQFKIIYLLNTSLNYK